MLRIARDDSSENPTTADPHADTDSDDDADTADLTITINGATEGVPTVVVDDTDAGATAADNSVIEATTVPITGLITVTAPDGFAAVTIADQDITDATNNPVTIIGDEGTLTVTGFDCLKFHTT